MKAALTWEITGETWESTPDGGGVTIEDKWYTARCRECGREVKHEVAWFKVKAGNVCECQMVKVGVEAEKETRRREPVTRTVRRIGLMTGRKGGPGRGVRVTDENERRVTASFTIPVGLVNRLGERASKERRSASEVVTELLRAYLTPDGSNNALEGASQDKS